MRLSSKKIDAAKIEGGVEVGEIPGWGDLKITTKGSNNSAWRDLRAKLIAEIPIDQLLPNGDVKPSSLEKIMIECLVETGVTGWSGLLNDDDTEMEFSKASLRAILESPDNALFRGACMYAANKVHDLSAAQAEKDAKN